jgi:GNAT superfamily N-acetyltransferase
MALSIRPFEVRDGDAVLALARELQAHEFPLFDRLKPPDAIGTRYLNHLRHECAQKQGTLLVAEADGRICGYATVLTHVVADDVEEVDYVFAQIGDLAVTEPDRGRGVGTALLAECERLAKQAGRDELRIGVLAGNHGARHAYDRFGFSDFAVGMRKKIA